jgi:predicted XRE-type DNA-binding protein
MDGADLLAGRGPGGQPDAGRGTPATHDPEGAGPATHDPEGAGPATHDAAGGGPATPDAGHEALETRGDDLSEPLPLLPGFREIALRRMAAQRRRLVTDLTAERQAARLSQTQVAARMGTSQSAVARLESGEADARASTLERYAAAIGCQITWELGTRDSRHGEKGGTRQ